MLKVQPGGHVSGREEGRKPLGNQLITVPGSGAVNTRSGKPLW